jgi:hypothetical protein
MTLAAGCPRCSSPVVAGSPPEAGWRCAEHGSITPLWRPAVADYDSFAEHVNRAAEMPTFAPWPLSPGWTVTDFGCVAARGRGGRAIFVSCSGPNDLDGVVEVTVVSEEPGVGLGARCAGLLRDEPGTEVGDGPPHARVRIGGHPVPLWSVLTSDVDVAFDRAVFAGEAGGRWLWMVLRPASAALLLRDEWILADLADFGPELIDLPFGGSPPAW